MPSSLRPSVLASSLVIALLVTACSGGIPFSGDADTSTLAIVASPAATPPPTSTPSPRSTVTVGAPDAPEPTASASADAAPTSEPTPSAEPTASTSAATASTRPTAAPTPSASPPPKAAPAPAPAPTPTATPKPSATPTPTSSPAPSPTPSPTPAPQPAPSPSPSGGNQPPPRANAPVFATAVDVDLYLPSDRVEVIGYHESNHDGARNMTPHGNLGVTMETRGRDTAARGSADVALPKDAAVYSPVTGTVKRAGTYTLYCKYSDDFLVIEPDAHPGWEVKLLHIDGVQVRAGDRVEAGVTLVAPRPTQLPFESQVNDHTAARDTPHVHIEVVDPSIKDRPSEGGGGC